MEFGRFCLSKPQNFANWPVEFGRIFCGKLWALLTCMISIWMSYRLWLLTFKKVSEKFWKIFWNVTFLEKLQHRTLCVDLRVERWDGSTAAEDELRRSNHWPLFRLSQQPVLLTCTQWEASLSLSVVSAFLRPIGWLHSSGSVVFFCAVTDTDRLHASTL